MAPTSIIISKKNSNVSTYLAVIVSNRRAGPDLPIKTQNNKNKIISVVYQKLFNVKKFASREEIRTKVKG